MIKSNHLVEIVCVKFIEMLFYADTNRWHGELFLFIKKSYNAHYIHHCFRKLYVLINQIAKIFATVNLYPLLDFLNNLLRTTYDAIIWHSA